MTTQKEMDIRIKVQRLEYVLDLLCQEADRQICVFLPEKLEEQVPYLKNEIKITLNRINDT